jgi:hypothetical protein
MRLMQTLIVAAMMTFTAMLVSGQAPAPQRERQADPAAVTADVQSVRSAVREINARLQQAARRQTLNSGSADARSAKAELESVSKNLNALDERLSRVLAHNALKPNRAANQTGRDLTPVFSEMQAITAEFSSSVARVNKIESFTIKMKAADSQQLQSDLEFIRKSAERTRGVLEGGFNSSTHRLPAIDPANRHVIESAVTRRNARPRQRRDPRS